MPSNRSLNSNQPPTDRVHSLVFDISSLNLKESVNHAELRLYTLIKRDQHSYFGVSRLVSVYEIIEFTDATGTTRTKNNFITAKYVYHMESEWDSFDVTHAVKRSVTERSNREILQVRIKSLSVETERDTLDILDVTADSNDQKQPLLVVYSNDNNPSEQRKKEQHELYMQELGIYQNTNSDRYTQIDEDYEEISDTYIDSAQFSNHDRAKRSNNRHKVACRRKEMYVSFQDINAKDIIAPRGYQVSDVQKNKVS